MDACSLVREQVIESVQETFDLEQNIQVVRDRDPTRSMKLTLMLLMQ